MTHRRRPAVAASAAPIMATASSISASVTMSGGASRSAVGVMRVDHESVGQQPAGDGLGVVARAARRRAAGPRPRIVGHARRGRAAPIAGGRRRLRASAGASRRSHLGEHGPGRGGRQRLAAVGGGVVAGLERRGDVDLGGARPDGHAVAERLGHGDDVGLHAEVLEAEPLAGAAEAGLDLVDHEQDAPLVAQALDALEVLGGGRVDAALALHGFEQDGGDRWRRAPAPARRGRPTARGGSPRAAAGTPPTSAAGRWRAGWPGCGRGSWRRRDTTVCRPRPPNLRASLMAASLASAPELQKNVW